MKSVQLIILLTFIELAGFSQTSMQWHLNSTGSSNGVVKQMLEFPNGDVLVTAFNSGGDMDPGPGISILDHPVCFARYTPSGNLVFCRPLSYNGNSPNGGSWTDIDSDGNFYYVIRGNGTFDLDTIPGIGEFVISGQSLIVKFDPMGNFLWGVVYTDDFTIMNLSALSDNSIVVSGLHYTGTGDVDPGPGTLMINTICAYDGFAAKFDSSGNFISGKQFQNTGGSFNSYFYLTEMDVDANDNIYFGGTILGTFDFDPGAGIYNLTGSTSSPNYEAFIFQLDINMDFAFAYDFPSGISPTDIIADRNNGYYMVGCFNESLDIDPFSGVTMIDTDLGFGSFYIARFDVTGHLLWAKTLKTTTSLLGQLASGLQIDDDGLLNFDFYLNGTIVSNSFGFSQLPTNGYSIPQFYMVKLDSTGTVVYSLRYPDYPAFQNHRSLKVGANNFFLSGRIMNTTDIQMGPGITVVSPTVGNEFMLSYYDIDPSLNRIEGSAFLDLNNNNLRDQNENGLNNLITEINPGNYFISTDNFGNYGAYVAPGNYGISLPTIPSYLSGPVPLMHSASFLGANQVDSTNNFAFTLNSNEMDVAVNLTRVGQARPGMNTFFNITYSNEGAMSQNGTVTFLLDSMVTLASSSLPPSSVNGQLLQWNYFGLNPLQSSNINLVVHIDSTMQIGDTLISIAEITSLVGDNFAANNEDINYTQITGSWDPNSKEVNPQGAITDEQVIAGEELTYILNFQNTGNDTAFFVTLLDTLSNSFDLSSLRIVSASHPYFFTLHPGNLMEFRFNNILLPDSNTNEPASHGFVKYKIKPKSDLIPGDFVENKAHIYFDFNVPVITNTTHTDIVDFVGIEEQHGQFDSKVYPNPFTNRLIIRTSNRLGEKIEYKIMDLAGKNIHKFVSSTEENTIDTGELSKGIYFLIIRNNTEAEYIKLIKL